MLIYLIGFMGCGKTTVGKKLAAHLDYNFIDLDKLIESNEGQSVPEIFSKKGESAFRELERLALHTTFNLTDTIVATGGGAPCFFDNIQQMNQHGATVYIEMDPKALANRVKFSKTPRPLLKGKTDEELVDHITQMLAKRAPFYNQATYKVDGITLSVTSVMAVLPSE
jgi:shikimate kinase